MAGEVFIARQDTLEAVKGTVDGIDSGVKQTNNALGNFSGGGTDTVKKELQTLKDSVAQLQTKVDQLLSKGGGLTSCVKSVQRGLIKSQEVTTNDPESDLKYAFINIQPINPDKSILLLYSSTVNYVSSSGATKQEAYPVNGRIYSPTQLVIYPTLYDNTGRDYYIEKLCWQVIEFY